MGENWELSLYTHTPSTQRERCVLLGASVETTAQTVYSLSTSPLRAQDHRPFVRRRPFVWSPQRLGPGGVIAWDYKK